MNQVIDKTDTDIGNILGNPYKCILFNDNTHSTEEVALQIMKAIQCTPDKAYEIMLQAHNTGSAIVITAGMEKCELVASILEQIGLATAVEQA